MLNFWKAFGIYNEGSVTEAIRELTRVQDRREIQYAAAVALIFYHEKCRNIDQETIDTFVLQLDEREEMASDKDLLCASNFLWHVQQLKRAGQIVQKILEMNPGNLNALALKGWIYLSAQKYDLQNKALGYFEAVLNEDDGGNHKHL